MKRRFINRINKMQAMLPNKMLRRQQFSKRIKNRRRHERYNQYSYRPTAKHSNFNSWQDYKRMINRSY